MSGLPLVVLALVQGITEFLPISSWGHRILISELAGWPVKGVVLDVAVHVGTLGAVMVYFRRDVWRLLAGAARLFAGRPDARTGLALQIAAASVPVVIAGAALSTLDAGALRTPVVIGWTTLGFGIVLYVVDRTRPMVRKVEHMTFRGALLIGLAQVLALVPGTSRSGITMTAARALGYTRRDAARFSMLLSIPVIIAAGTPAGLELYRTADAQFINGMLSAAAVAFGTALAAIGVLMRWLARASFTPFVVYRVALGVLVLTLAYW